MRELERQPQRSRRWFRGRRATLARHAMRAIGRWSRFDVIAADVQASARLHDFAFVASSL